MDELIKLVQEKTGIGEEQARDAVNTVLGFVKERLPEPLGSQLDGMLGGGAGGSNPLGGLGNLGGLTGG
ncbi:MAG: DUF2267 domain-containing protein [Candidatus Limnocylindrales bacterium]